MVTYIGEHLKMILFHSLVGLRRNSSSLVLANKFHEKQAQLKNQEAVGVGIFGQFFKIHG